MQLFKTIRASTWQTRTVFATGASTELRLPCPGQGAGVPGDQCPGRIELADIPNLNMDQKLWHSGSDSSAFIDNKYLPSLRRFKNRKIFAARQSFICCEKNMESVEGEQSKVFRSYMLAGNLPVGWSAPDTL